MNTPPDSIHTGYLEKLQAMTASWFSQVLFYLALVVVFFAIDQLLVADLYRKHFYYPGSIFNWLFFAGEWIPALANAMAIAMVIRGRITFAYFTIAALLTGVLSVAYCYIEGLDFSNDRMLGSAAPVYAWIFFWFCGGVVGSIIKNIEGRLS